jgi:tRNA/tmRNA/rRNA uracil-C5-methylase (TrmA/RlmC/RlmD family)
MHGLALRLNQWLSKYPAISLIVSLLTIVSQIATQIAESAPAGRSILVDCFAGAGGNTIAFALTGKWKRVYGIEKNPAVLKCAKHNAKIYGVENKITWFEGDCFEILKNQLKELAPYSVVFASPPWGGKHIVFLDFTTGTNRIRPRIPFG